MLKVLIVDDELIVRAGLINCINWKMLELQLIGEASNGQEALQIILQDTPDIILLDLIMPEMTGMELLQKLEDLNIKTNIIILSCHEDYTHVRNAFKKGVRDYIPKLSATPDEISTIISDVAKKIIKQQQKSLSDISYESLYYKGIRSDIAKALKYIEEHYSENISLSGIASHIHMSKNHFSYLFRKETGHSFNDYLTEVRINKAKLLLTSPQTYTIAEIAEMTGFNDTGYFGKVFKKSTGMSPIHYKSGGSYEKIFS